MNETDDLPDPNVDRLMVVQVSPDFLLKFLQGKTLPTESNLPADAVVTKVDDDSNLTHGKESMRDATKIFLLVRSREFERHIERYAGYPVFNLELKQ